MPIYRVDYTNDDGDHSLETEEQDDFWADDVAYALTDKGPYKVYRKVIAPKTIAGSYWEFAFDSYTSTSRKFKLEGGFYVRRR